jgi:hypothetical protein
MRTINLTIAVDTISKSDEYKLEPLNAQAIRSYYKLSQAITSYYKVLQTNTLLGLWWTPQPHLSRSGREGGGDSIGASIQLNHHDPTPLMEP